MSTIKDLLLKASRKRRNEEERSSREEKEFQLALQLSQQEHINEQKKLYEKLTRLGDSKFKEFKPKKKRLIAQDQEEEEDNDDDDDIFQTVSTRQTKVKKEKVKKEDENPFEFDLSSIFNSEEKEEEKDDEDDDDNNDVELGKFFKDNASTKITTTIRPPDNTLPMVSDAESDDCSVIDLCEEDSEKLIRVSAPASSSITTNTNINTTIHTIDDEDDEDDGYLSPLEGFTSLKDSEVGQQYLAQFEPKPTRKKRASSSSTSTSTTTTTTKKRRFNKRWFNKKKKKDK